MRQAFPSTCTTIACAWIVAEMITQAIFFRKVTEKKNTNQIMVKNSMFVAKIVEAEHKQDICSVSQCCSPSLLLDTLLRN